jgi:hypothetical protein
VSTGPQAENDNVTAVDTRDMKKDSMVLAIVDNPPRIALIGEAAFQAPAAEIVAGAFQSPDLFPFFVSPAAAAC